jgi:glutamine cyclotransferase
MNKVQSSSPSQRTRKVRRRRQFYRNLALGVVALLAIILVVFLNYARVVSPTAPTPMTAVDANAPATLSPTDLPLPTFTSTPLVSALTSPDPLMNQESTAASNTAQQPASPLTVSAPVYTYEVVATYPHDPTAFTQGLVFDGDVLYEGTGLTGRSTLRRVEWESGAVLQQVALREEYFGEGVSIFGDKIYQLTWRSHIALVYDKMTFEQVQTFDVSTEGWGLTQDGERLILSDGTARLYFIDPVSFTQTGYVDVFDNNGPVLMLNELEYIRGEVYANVWQSDRIARIDPTSGQVVGWIDLSGLLAQGERANTDAVLNGIAYLASQDRLFVTGKLWPKLFEIKLIPLP